MSDLISRRLTNAEGNIAKAMKLINKSADLHLAVATVLNEHNVRLTAIEAYITKQQGGLK